MPILLIAIMATTVIRSIAVSRDLDFLYGYFNSHTLIKISNWAALAFVLLFFALALATPKQKKLIPTFDTPASYIPAALSSIAILFLAKELFIFHASYMQLLANSKSASVLLAITPLLSGLLAICAVVGLIFFSLFSNVKNEKRALGLLSVSLFLVVYAIYLYFSTQLPLNSPNKITDQVAFISAAVFFLFEARLSLGREMWRSYLAFGYSSALICAYSSIPSLAVYFIKGEIISNSIYETLVTFTLFIFISARLILASEFEKDEDCNAVKEIKAELAAIAEKQAQAQTEAEEQEAKAEEAEASPDIEPIYEAYTNDNYIERTDEP